MMNNETTVLVNNLKETLMKDLKPNYTSVKFFIDAGYKWGKGWTVDSTPFKNEMLDIFMHQLKWDVTIPAEDSSSAIKVKKWGEYLYLHPMELSGYMNEKEITSMAQILSDCQTFGLKSVKNLGGLYSLAESEIFKIFTRSDVVEALDNLLFSVFNTPRYDYIIFDKIYHNVRIPLVDTYCGGSSSNELQYLLILQEIEVLIRMGKLKKDKKEKIYVAR